jgi:hypothetical protein
MATMIMDRATAGGTVPAKPSARPSFFGHAFRIFVASAGLGDRSPLIGLRHMSVAPTFEGQVTALGL